MQRGLIRFVLEDVDKLQEEVYDKAIADARMRAERLAKLSNVELGPVTAVREIIVPSDRFITNDEEMPKHRLEVGRFQEIPIRVELQVRFEIHSKSAKK